MEQQYLAVHCRSDRAPTLTAHAILVLQPCYSYHPHRSAGAAARARRLHRKVKARHPRTPVAVAVAALAYVCYTSTIVHSQTTDESEMHACMAACTMHHANSNGCAWHAMHAILLLPWKHRAIRHPIRTKRKYYGASRHDDDAVPARDRACMSMAWLRV